MGRAHLVFLNEVHSIRKEGEFRLIMQSPLHCNREEGALKPKSILNSPSFHIVAPTHFCRGTNSHFHSLSHEDYHWRRNGIDQADSNREQANRCH